ncbi:hypothetical protein BHM03_00036717 [Ensete ventricosum]|nr:hypothetical protein BHM03_00036717 [Ensete ventricosum]
MLHRSSNPLRPKTSPPTIGNEEKPCFPAFIAGRRPSYPKSTSTRCPTHIVPGLPRQRRKQAMNRNLPPTKIGLDHWVEWEPKSHLKGVGRRRNVEFIFQGNMKTFQDLDQPQAVKVESLS